MTRITSGGVLKYPVLLSGFGDVDSLANPETLVEYLETNNADPALRLCKQQVLESLELDSGDHVIDVGCGVGHISCDLARKVGPTGRVVGIDSSRIMIESANKRLRGLDIASVDYFVQDANQLSFKDASFDAGLIIHTLIHVGNPQQVLSEMFRVAKLGRKVAVMESDWQLLAISTGNPVVDNILTSLLQGSVRNSGIAHQLPTLMKMVGFTDISVGVGTIMAFDFPTANQAWHIQDVVEHATATNALSESEQQMIVKNLVRSTRDGTFFGASTGFVATGRRPSCC